MCEIINKINEYKVIPVVTVKDIDKTLQQAKILSENGLPIMEITMRTDISMNALKEISKKYPDILIGAGTILTIEQAKQAIKYGAKFLVSPGFNKKLVKYCIKHNIIIIPGCVTPTEIEMALNCNLSVIKFFPAELSGGVNMIKALSAPYNNISFIPTGGINLSNLKDYLSFKKVLACGGSFMIDDDLEKSKKIINDTQKIINEI